MAPSRAARTVKEEYQTGIGHLFDIAAGDYHSTPPLLQDLCYDLVDLYEGRWPNREACQVGYHTVEHALDVALATARMIAGWNKIQQNRKIPLELFLAAMAAALFHDAGYLKDRGDLDGRGGKFTFNHVGRSIELARQYLQERGWPAPVIALVPKLVSLTEFHEAPEIEGRFEQELEEVVGRMVATADLVAQMADVDYMRSIKDLFDEFQEAYDFEGREKLQKKGVHIFGSLQEILDGTIPFYENFVLPRLEQLGRMDQYLIAFFGEGRNPYLENIAANLSGQLMDERMQWRRLGDILQELGVVNPQQIEEALQRQKIQKESKRRWETAPFRQRLLAWQESQPDCRCLGDILMDMGVIDPSVLREGLLTQILPSALLENLSRAEMLALLRITILLPNICKGPWVIGQVAEMITEMLDCEAGSILFRHPEKREMVAMIQAGPRPHPLGRTIPLDKGLSGWVYQHGRPASLDNILQDERYNGELDSRIGLEARSILAVPVFMNGECIGVLEQFNKKNGSFTSHDMDVLTMLANMIATTFDCVIRPREADL